MTIIEQWAANATRGARFVYHSARNAKQQIGAIRAKEPGYRTPKEDDAMAEAAEAWAQYEARRVTLVQRRTDSGGIDYEAVRL